MITPHRLWIWCKRFRHRCGYGVHSPSDFFLITSVIYEKQPYYAYSRLKDKEFPSYLPHYRNKVNRLLFRLVNYFHPDTLVEVGVGNGASISYMQAARTSMNVLALKGYDAAKTLGLLQNKLKVFRQLDFLHIAHTPLYREVFEQALPYASASSCFVVGGIHSSKEKRQWWEQIKADERVGETFDLYDIGLVFFDTKHYKHHYIVNFL